MNVTLTIRRIGVALAVAIVITGIVVLITQDADALGLFLPLWIGLFFGWPFLSRKLGFNFPKPPSPQSLKLSIRRLFGTFMLASVFSVTLARMLEADVAGYSLIPFWLALYYGWHYLDRRLTLTRLRRAPTLPTPKRPLRRRLIRGSLKWAGGIALVLVCMFSSIVGTIALSRHRAQKVADSIHNGMTVPEVIHTARNCDIFSAGSDFPYNQKTDGDHIPAMGLSWRKDGTYRTYDVAAGKEISLTEAEAVERLHAILHDGYKWYFHYTYINPTPMHMTFIVVFGTDGRVSEVKPVYGWD